MSSTRGNGGKAASAKGLSRQEKAAPKLDEQQVAEAAASRLTQFAQARELSRSGARKSETQAKARSGVAGAKDTLPYLDVLQQAFGPNHDLSRVSAAVGGSAKLACDDLSAQGYAMGENVAFAQQPSLWVAAHETAHVLQQRGSDVKGRDANERLANHVADRVVNGEPVHGLLSAASTPMSESVDAMVQYLKDGELSPADEALEEDVDAAVAEDTAAEEEQQQREQEEKEHADQLKTTLSHFDQRFLDTKDHISLLGSWLPTLAEASLLTPDAPAAVMQRVSALCSAAFAQLSKMQGDERSGNAASLEDAVKGGAAAVKGISKDPAFNKDFGALFIKALAEFRKSLHKEGSGGRGRAEAWGVQMVRELAG